MDWSLCMFKMNDQKSQVTQSTNGIWETTVIMKAISLLSLREQGACCQLNIKFLGSWGQCARGQEQSGELAAVILFSVSQRGSGAGADERRTSLPGQAGLTCLPGQRGPALVSWDLAACSCSQEFLLEMPPAQPPRLNQYSPKSQNIRMPLSLMRFWQGERGGFSEWRWISSRVWDLDIWFLHWKCSSA